MKYRLRLYWAADNYEYMNEKDVYRDVTNSFIETVKRRPDNIRIIVLDSNLGWPKVEIEDHDGNILIDFLENFYGVYDWYEMRQFFGDDVPEALGRMLYGDAIYESFKRKIYK